MIRNLALLMTAREPLIVLKRGGLPYKVYKAKEPVKNETF